MADNRFISIDQNSNPLWDPVPKLHALARQGWRGTHYVEDIDVAFTQRGVGPEHNEPTLAREQYYRDGSSDWGTALFYADFLGRNMLDVHQVAGYAGYKTSTLAKKLNYRDVDALFDAYSPGDTLQLVGPSYMSNAADTHRTIGDLCLAETQEYVFRLLEHARENLLERFPEEEPRARIDEWFSNQRTWLHKLLQNRGSMERLVELYKDWMEAETSDAVDVRYSSELFSFTPERLADEPGFSLFKQFLRDYDRMADLHNEAVHATDTAVKPLDTSAGELPFFVVRRRESRQLRTSLYLSGNKLSTGDGQEWTLGRNGAVPAAELQAAGVNAVAGKALVLVLQARCMKQGGGALCMPYKGSQYMNVAHRFEANLRKAEFLPDTIPPIMRVRFNVFDHWRRCSTIIRLPSYLSGAFSADELPAWRFAEEYPAVLKRAQDELARLTDDTSRQVFMHELFADKYRKREFLRERQRTLAEDPQTRPQAGEVWKQIKAIDEQLLDSLVKRIVQNIHITGLEHWNSRGAVYPWSIALGGQQFYEHILQQAEIYPERPGESQTA